MNEPIATGEVYYLIEEKIINCLKLHVIEIAELIDQLDGIVVTHRDGTTATYIAGEMAAMPTGQFAGLLQHLVDANINGRIPSPHRETLDELAEQVIKGDVQEVVHRVEPVDDRIKTVDPSVCRTHEENHEAHHLIHLGLLDTVDQITLFDLFDRFDHEIVRQINERIDHLVYLGLDHDLTNPYRALAHIADRMDGILAKAADVIQTNYPIDVGEFGDTVGEITVWTYHPDMNKPTVNSWELSSIDAGVLTKGHDWVDGVTHTFSRSQLLPLLCSNTSAVPPEMRRVAVGLDPRFRSSGTWQPGPFIVKYRPFVDEDGDGDE